MHPGEQDNDGGHGKGSEEAHAPGGEAGHHRGSALIKGSRRRPEGEPGRLADLIPCEPKG